MATKNSNTAHAHALKIAADSLETLRKSDVYRVLEASRFDAGLAAYISVGRPDLATEVAECLEDA